MYTPETGKCNLVISEVKKNAFLRRSSTNTAFLGKKIQMHSLE
jgi:hypothetical protein